MYRGYVKIHTLKKISRVYYSKLAIHSDIEISIEIFSFIRLRGHVPVLHLLLVYKFVRDKTFLFASTV